MCLLSWRRWLFDTVRLQSGSPGFSSELLLNGAQTLLHGAANHAGVELEKAEVLAAPVFCEIYPVAVAEAHEKGRVFHGAVYGLLSPPVECRAKLGPKVAQADEGRARQLPSQDGRPEHQRYLGNFVDDDVSAEGRILVQAGVKRTVHCAGDRDVLRSHVRVARAAHRSVLLQKLPRYGLGGVRSTGSTKPLQEDRLAFGDQTASLVCCQCGVRFKKVFPASRVVCYGKTVRYRRLLFAYQARLALFDSKHSTAVCVCYGRRSLLELSFLGQ